MAVITMPQSIIDIITIAHIDYVQPGQVSLTSKYTGSESILTSGEGYYIGEMRFGPVSGIDLSEEGEVFLSRLRGRQNTVFIPTFRRVAEEQLTVAAFSRAKRTISFDKDDVTEDLSALIGAFYRLGTAHRVYRLVSAVLNMTNTRYVCAFEPYPDVIAVNNTLTPTGLFYTRSVRADTGQMFLSSDFKGPWLYQWREAF